MTKKEEVLACVQWLITTVPDKRETGATTQEIAEKMQMQRSNISTLLNELVQEGKLEKLSGRPVCYRPCNLPHTVQKETSCFKVLAGCEGCLKPMIQLAKAAILYPEHSLNTLIVGAAGVGKTTFAYLMYQFAQENDVIAQQAPFERFSCHLSEGQEKEVGQRLFGPDGAMQHAAGGMLFIDSVDNLSSSLRERLLDMIDSDGQELQKVVLISVAAMAVAFAILTFVFHRLEGVKFEEGFLRVSAQADDPAATVYAGKIQGERVKITVTDCPDEQRTAVEVQVGDRVRDECVVETGLPPIQADQLGPVEHIRITRNGQLLFEGGYTAEHDMGWYDLEGNWDPFTMSVSYSSTAGDDYWEHYETDRGTILSFARGPQLVSRGSWMLYFTMLLFSGLLALDAAYPLALFRCQHMCDVKDPEPSDFYLGMQRAGWCIYPILLLIGYNIALWVLP